MTDAAQNVTPKRAELDRGFQAWLAMNEYLVECEFLIFDVDGMPDDPYTEEGLRIAEAEALRRFPDLASARAPENAAMFDKFVRFLGETLVRRLNGEWTNDAGMDREVPYIGVQIPEMSISTNIPLLVTSAMARRTGDRWAFVLRAQENLQRERREGTDELFNAIKAAELEEANGEPAAD